MAQNGQARTNTITDDDSDWKYLEFNWWIKEQSIEKNKTTIGYSIYGRGNSGYILTGKFKLKFDNNDVWSKSEKIQLYDGTLVKSGEYTFDHNDYGERSFTVYLECDIYYGVVNSTCTKTFAIDKIDRGLVRFGINNEWKICEVYRCVNGEWKKVQPYFGSNGEWKQCN